MAIVEGDRVRYVGGTEFDSPWLKGEEGAVRRVEPSRNGDDYSADVDWDNKDARPRGVFVRNLKKIEPEPVEVPAPTDHEQAYAELVEGLNHIETALTCLGPEGAKDWPLYDDLLDSMKRILRTVGSLEDYIGSDRDAA